ncbi:MAG TPA: tRNA 2-thiouridine(34) synthase MnmA [Candidatus Limnocylindria bacterium]|nr:tRNA 2-thiouridine(34) synthase MnmA [Candidatus Limnocylindria bacterium]
MSRVFVAMSGGVDSSVAAALLAERGADVVGVWMRLTPSGTSGDAPRCCGTDEAGEDARRAAGVLGIPFYALDYAEVFGREVVDRFVDAYAAGETPNPCVACNHHVKFAALMRDVAAKFGADRLATGHYARVEHGQRHRLLRARDAAKDQSYALYMLGQRELARLELPIGELAGKSETRAIAVRFGLPTANKPDSQDLCFIGGDYRDFVRSRAPEAFVPGPVERLDGTVVAQHGGIGTLTVGQRSGTGVASGERMYVLRIEPDRRAAIVGTREEISASSYELRDVRFTGEAPPAARFRTDAVLRYRGTPLAGSVTVHDDRAVLDLDAPALVAPGQAAVFYEGDAVLGGGIVAGVRAA